MDSTYQLLSALLFILCLYYLLYKPITKTKNDEAPVPAGAWPIMGHLHMLRGPNLPHITLSSMADKHGPAFTIRLGTRRALVVSNSDLAKECFTVNDKAFSSRPSTVATKLMGYNNTMFGFAPYGPYWRELRKIVMTELLSSRRLESLASVWASEIESSVKELFADWAENRAKGPVVVEMGEWFGNLTLNIALRMVVGKRYLREESRKCLKAMRDYPELFGRFLVEDAVPFLGWLDLIQGYQREMKKTARELDSVLEKWLEEHKDKRGSGEGKGEHQDFMDVMISVLEDSKLSYGEADRINKSTCLNLILGAADTTMVALTWALSLLLNNKQVLKRAQQELKSQIGNNKQVSQSDIKNLLYLQAIVKEALRLYPPEPLSGPREALEDCTVAGYRDSPREALEDCTVAGYRVRAGIRLIVNLWKIHRDPSIWPDPLEFRPERFLMAHKDVDVCGQHFELMPFGSGRRSCPGISFVLQVVPLILARLLHGFELTTLSEALVDMSESAGLVNAKATPLEVVISPRLPLDFLAG